MITLLAAAGYPELRSLTVIEPPCLDVARGHPAVEAFARVATRSGDEGPREPEAFLRGFLRAVGSPFEPPSPLPPELEQGARTLIVERGPWEATIPLAELARAPFPKLVVSGGHHEAFDAVCDVLEERLDAERAILPGRRPQRPARARLQRASGRLPRPRERRVDRQLHGDGQTLALVLTRSSGGARAGSRA